MQQQQLFESLYGPASDRQPLPALYVPLGVALSLGSIYLGHSTLHTFFTCSALLALALYRPTFTTGNASQDYTTSAVCVSWILSCLDFVVLSPRSAEEGEPRYLGRLRDGKDVAGGLRRRDATSWGRRLGWAVRLQFTARGIGWNWQVKGVPDHPSGKLSRSQFVALQAAKAVQHEALKLLALYILEFCLTIRGTAGSPLSPPVLDLVVGWCGAVWGWQTITAVYSAAAAVSVLLGICEPWEWPPVVGPLSTAWSVRQMWRYVFTGALQLSWPLLTYVF
jgi:hypothetical protein